MTHQVINPKLLKLEAVRREIDIDQELAAIEETLETRLAQIRRKSHIAWQKFPARLLAHGKRLIEQGKRMAKLSPMPTKSRPLRKFNSPQEWQRSLYQSDD
jgi:hypothetical protein